MTARTHSTRQKLLDILKERHIHATFFVVGQMVKAHPEILKREIAEGHEVGNHTWDHLPLPKVVEKEDTMKEVNLAAIESEIEEQTGETTPIAH